LLPGLVNVEEKRSSVEPLGKDCYRRGIFSSMARVLFRRHAADPVPVGLTTDYFFLPLRFPPLIGWGAKSPEGERGRAGKQSVDG